MKFLYTQPQTSSISLVVNSSSNTETISLVEKPVRIPAIMLAAAITAGSITLPISPIHADSSVSYKRDAANIPKIRGSKESIVAFSTELYKRSRSMTNEESSFVRNMILSKAMSGIPKF